MRLRALMTSGTDGGAWTFAMELASALSRSGSQVDLATQGEGLTPAQRAEAEDVPRLRLHEGRSVPEWNEDDWLAVDQAGEWLLDLERSLGPDVVHLNGYVHGALPWRAPVVMTGQSCVLSWFAAVHGIAPPSTWDRYAEEVARGLRAAHVVTTPTRAMGEALRHHYGEDLPIRVIPNGRSIPPPPVVPKRHRILSVGRLSDPGANVAAMDRVAARLSWHVVVAGETKNPDGEVIRLKNARALGALEPSALAKAYAGAAIFALPALYEPFGYAALEAALSGCALVLGDIPSLREVWGDAACWVPPRDDEALLQTLRWLIDDRQVRRDYAKRAKERALAYTPERTAAGYMDAYRMALAEPTELLRAQA
jgi:glycogen(starch) synthase